MRVCVTLTSYNTNFTAVWGRLIENMERDKRGQQTRQRSLPIKNWKRTGFRSHYAQKNEKQDKQSFKTKQRKM